MAFSDDSEESPRSNAASARQRNFRAFFNFSDRRANKAKLHVYSSALMTVVYHSHEHLFLRWHGTVLPRTWQLTLCTGLFAFGLCFVYDEQRKAV